MIHLKEAATAGGGTMSAIDGINARSSFTSPVCFNLAAWLWPGGACLLASFSKAGQRKRLCVIVPTGILWICSRVAPSWGAGAADGKG